MNGSAQYAPSIYLDYNATTPLLPEVIEVMRRAMDSCYGNPSSLHESGRKGRALLEESRERILSILAGTTGELTFTSGGTEANSLAILTALGLPGTITDLLASPGKTPAHVAGPHAVVSAIEHPSTLEIYKRLEQTGLVRISWVSPDENGRVSPRSIKAALCPETTIVSLMHANNETGVIQDIHGVAKMCRARDILLHCDAVQSLGKLPLSLDRLGADLVTLSAHKVYGPRGIGGLWVRHGLALHHPWGGGPQEKGLRPGTENLLGAAAFAGALEHMEIASPELRDRLWQQLESGCKGTVLNGARDFLVPNTLNLSFEGITAELLLIRLDMAGVHASSGSACSSGAREPSHVLRAMGLEEDRIAAAVRLSLGRGLCAADIDRAGEIITRSVAALREARDG